MSGYRHGIYSYEVPTGIVPPVTVDSALPVVFVTAPIHLSENPYSVTNVPKLISTYDEGASTFGFHLKDSIWKNYTAPQVLYSQFVLYACAPIVMTNVLDPTKHVKKTEDIDLAIVDRMGVLEVDGVLADTVKVKSNVKPEMKLEEDFTLAFNDEGFVVINLMDDSIHNITLSYTELDPSTVDLYDFIGGYNVSTQQYAGLELINEIYPRFRMVPGQILVPGYSEIPSVAAVMESKADNINGHFRCIAINDMPTFTQIDSKKAKMSYTDVPAWSKANNYVSAIQVNTYPKVMMGKQEFYLSTQLAGLICKVDSNNNGTPYESPSNKNLNINGLCFEGGDELVLNNEQANYLNGNGIVTAINFTKGWVSWGNRTGAYPGNTDAKDAFIPIRRMFNWIANTIVLTYWGKVDLPMTKRNIYTIVDSINAWFNSLAAREAILGGRVEFREDENQTIDLIDGIVRFHYFIAPPPPMETMEFISEYDTSYLSGLFN